MENSPRCLPPNKAQYASDKRADRKKAKDAGFLGRLRWATLEDWKRLDELAAQNGIALFQSPSLALCSVGRRSHVLRGGGGNRSPKGGKSSAISEKTSSVASVLKQCFVNAAESGLEPVEESSWSAQKVGSQQDSLDVGSPMKSCPPAEAHAVGFRSERPIESRRDLGGNEAAAEVASEEAQEDENKAADNGGSGSSRQADFFGIWDEASKDIVIQAARPERFGEGEA